MTGACIIDGTDIATIGALILRGGDHGFISFPQRKAPTMIEWPDADGFEISTNAPVYDAKKLTVHYYLKGDETTFKSRLNAFVSLHEASGYRAIQVREFGLTFNLRYAGISDFSMSRGFTTTGEKSARISIDYVMDDPLQFIDTEVVVPTANRSIQTEVKIGGVDLSAFGIIVKGVYSGAFRSGVKDRLLYSSAYTSGNTADTSYAPYKGKQDIPVVCTMICADATAFMSNWNALFNALNVSSFTLNLSAAEKQFKCYYSGMSNFTKRPWTSRGIASFEINLTGYQL